MDTKHLEDLLSDHNFKLELQAYKSAYQRLKVRLRNNPFTGQLKQLANMIKSLEKDFSIELLKTFNQKLEKTCDDVKKKRHFIKSYLKFLIQMINQVDKLIEKTLFIYAQTQPRLRVGHLVHHYLVVKSSIARIRMCFKALLIYSCDLYIDICRQYKYKGKSLPNCNDICQVLLKNDCKPRVERSQVVKVSDNTKTDDPIHDDNNIRPMEIDADEIRKNLRSDGEGGNRVTNKEQIGQLIDRETMKPVDDRRQLRRRPGASNSGNTKDKNKGKNKDKKR